MLRNTRLEFIPQSTALKHCNKPCESQPGRQWHPGGTYYRSLLKHMSQLHDVISWWMSLRIRFGAVILCTTSRHCVAGGRRGPMEAL